MRKWHSFMALGDSFTEGLEDANRDGTYRGWADRLAELMVVENPDLRYANLAIRGDMMEDIITKQVPLALAERPDLVTLCAGGNDLIVPGANIDQLAEQFGEVVRTLRDNGSEVVMFTGPDVKHMPVVRAVRAKVALYNTHLWSIADRYGALMVDLWGMDVLHDARAWSDDRLHFSPDGHHKIALRIAETLGMPIREPWNTPWPRVPQDDWIHLRQKDITWARTHLLPWALRQLRGESMGDGLSPKRPTLQPLQEITVIEQQRDLAG